MDNKHRKLFVIEQSKGYKFMPKIIKMRSIKPLAAMGAYF